MLQPDRLDPQQRWSLLLYSRYHVSLSSLRRDGVTALDPTDLCG